MSVSLQVRKSGYVEINMYIRVRVTAGAKKEVLTPKAGGFLVSVKEPATQNLANKRVIELVALHYTISPKKVRIVNGHHAPSKILSVDMEKEK